MSRHNRERREHRGRDRRLRQQVVALQVLCDRVRARGRCILCGRPTEDLYLWSPGPELARRLLVPEGKTRMIPYTACVSCQEGPGMTRIEEVIVAGWERLIARVGTN